MAKRILRLVLIVPLIFLASAPGCRPRSTADTERISQPAKLVAAEQLRDTDVLPYLDGPIVPGRNYLYCATFQLAWNQSQEKVFREPIHLAGSPKMAEYLLRGDKLSESILPPNSYLLRAGLVKDGVVAEIREEMERRFPHATFQVPEPQKPVWAVVFAYLQRSLAFREAFDRLEKPLVFHAKNGPVKLASFGVRNLDVNSPRHALFLVHRLRRLSTPVTTISCYGSTRPPRRTRSCSRRSSPGRHSPPPWRLCASGSSGAKDCTNGGQILLWAKSRS